MKDWGSKFVKTGDALPDNYTRINDKIARVMSLDDAGQLDGATGSTTPREFAAIVNNYLAGLAQTLRNTIKAPISDKVASDLDAPRLNNTLNRSLGLLSVSPRRGVLWPGRLRNALGLEYLASGNRSRQCEEVRMAAPARHCRASSRAPIGDLADASAQDRYTVGLRPKITKRATSRAASPMLAAERRQSPAEGCMDSFYERRRPEDDRGAWKKGELRSKLRATRSARSR